MRSSSFLGVVIERLSLDADTKAQLLCGKTGGTTPLSPVYDLMVAREAGDWESVSKLTEQLRLAQRFVDKSFIEAMRWAHEVTGENGQDTVEPT
jgi:hypothetical protein